MPFTESVKKEAKELAHYKCVACRNELAVDVHHILSQEKGGPDDLDNAAPLCAGCHDKYGHDPYKRRLLRGARDQWWELCKTKAHPETAILERLEELKSSLVTRGEPAQLKSQLASSSARHDIADLLKNLLNEMERNSKLGGKLAGRPERKYLDAIIEAMEEKGETGSLLDPLYELRKRTDGQESLSAYGSSTIMNDFKGHYLPAMERAKQEINKYLAGLEPSESRPRANDDWEARYPGGLADVSMKRGGRSGSLNRFAIAQDFTLINSSSHPVSLDVTLLIIYGGTQIAVDPRNLPLSEWEQLLSAFGIRPKSQLVFPLNLQGHSAAEGHILFSIRPEGQGKGLGGDIPEKRQYLLEVENLQTKRKSTLPVSAAYALDKNNHQRLSQTDLAMAGPREEPFCVD